MNVALASKLLLHLAKIGNPKLANKIAHSLRTGKVLDLTRKEQQAFNVIRHDFVNKLETAKDLGHGMSIRQGAFYNPKGGSKGGGAISRSYFGGHKNVPIADIDLKDPLSHAAEQVAHATLKDFQPALLDFMKTRAGQHSALKIYRTPAGMRIFDVGKKWRGTKPYVYEGALNELGSDPRYISHAIKSGRYNTRMFPKPGRDTNIWNLPGNRTKNTFNFASENPGDFVAKQASPNKVLMGSKAEIDPISWKESLFHDRVIKQVINRKQAKGVIKVNNLLDLVDF